MTKDKYNKKKSENPENNLSEEKQSEEKQKRFKFDKKDMYKIKFDF